MTHAVPRLIRLPRHDDARGGLVVAELGAALPFAVARWFAVVDVPTGSVRGEHLHLEGDELLCCLTGSVVVDTVAEDGEKAEFVLDDPALALHLPSGVWARQRDFTSDAVLLVACSHTYDPDVQRTEQHPGPR